jgi:hypothetical protein
MANQEFQIAFSKAVAVSVIETPMISLSMSFTPRDRENSLSRFTESRRKTPSALRTFEQGAIRFVSES